MKDFTTKYFSSTKFAFFSTVIGLASKLFVLYATFKYIPVNYFASSIVILSIYSFLVIFSEFGVSNSVNSFENVTSTFLNSILSLNIILGVFFFSVGVVFLFILKTDNLIYFISLFFTIPFFLSNGFFNSYFQLYKLFKEQFITQVLFKEICRIIFLLIFLFVTKDLLGALIFPSALCEIGACIYSFFFYKSRFKFGLDKETVISIKGFSSDLFITKLLNFFSQNFLVFLASSWSLISFGQFSAATQISKNVYTFVTVPFTKNYIAFFSPKNLSENQTNFIRLHKLQMYFFAIPYILIFYIFDDVLHLFYQNKWDGAIIFINILLLSMSFRAFSPPGLPVFLSHMKTRLFFKISFVTFCISIFISLLIYLLKFSLFSSVILFVLVDFVFWTLSTIFCFKILKFKSYFYFLKPLLGYLALFVFAFLINRILNQFLTKTTIDIIIKLIIFSMIFLVTYFLYLYTVFKSFNLKKIFSNI